MLELITSEELAKKMRYASANAAFRDWLALLKITPVPGRRGFYDPSLVRKRLDEAQGLDAKPVLHNPDDNGVKDLVAERRLRRGKN